MALIDNDVRRISMEGHEEDFGFVQRDKKLLEKVLVNEPDPTKQVTRNSGSQVGEDVPDVTDKGPSGGGDGVSVEGLSSEMKSVSCEENDEQGGRVGRKVGLLNAPVESEEFKTVYDASKLKVGSPGPKSIYGESAKLKTSPRVSETGSTKQSSSGNKSVLSKSSSSPAKPVSKSTMSGKLRDDCENIILPQNFQVKYLGHRDASGLWGIKHTRKPVDHLVTAARNLSPGTVLPIVRLVISKEGLSVLPLGKSQEALKFHAIDTISYGVQDLVYTRVFCIIIVRETSATGVGAQGRHPFECHAFVCDSRNGARRLTYALSAAFKEFSKSVKEGGDKVSIASVKKKFAIDLRSPEEIEEDLKGTEDSEA